MAYVSASIAIFLITEILHIILHRILRAKGILTMKSSVIFLGGLAVDLYAVYSISGETAGRASNGIWLLPIPFSGIMVYIFLSLVFIIFYTHPAVPYISPSTLLLGYLTKKRMRYSEIIRRFTNKMLIDERLDDLEESGLVIRKGSIYSLTTRGQNLAKIMEFYKRLFGGNS